MNWNKEGGVLVSEDGRFQIRKVRSKGFYVYTVIDMRVLRYVGARQLLSNAKILCESRLEQGPAAEKVSP